MKKSRTAQIRVLVKQDPVAGKKSSNRAIIGFVWNYSKGN
jgi:hypothetical protein